MQYSRYTNTNFRPRQTSKPSLRLLTNRNMPRDGRTCGRRPVLLPRQGTRVLRSTIWHVLLQRGLPRHLLSRLLFHALRAGGSMLSQNGKNRHTYFVFCLAVVLPCLCSVLLLYFGPGVLPVVFCRCGYVATVSATTRSRLFNTMCCVLCQTAAEVSHHPTSCASPFCLIRPLPSNSKQCLVRAPASALVPIPPNALSELLLLMTCVNSCVRTNAAVRGHATIPTAPVPVSRTGWEMIALRRTVLPCSALDARSVRLTRARRARAATMWTRPGAVTIAFRAPATIRAVRGLWTCFC